MKIIKNLTFTVLAVAAFATLSALGPTQLALADAGGEKGHTFHVTFTKWVTSLPVNPPSLAGVSMAGVVGGDVGDGTFAGEVLGVQTSHYRTLRPAEGAKSRWGFLLN